MNAAKIGPVAVIERYSARAVRRGQKRRFWRIHDGFSHENPKQLIALGFAIVVLGSTFAAKIGLVVITLERYFKVVHAVGHRQVYRRWMTALGVAVPWISGISTFVVPAAVSTRPVPGQCPMMGFWPSKGGGTVRQNWKSFIVRYAR